MPRSVTQAGKAFPLQAKEGILLARTYFTAWNRPRTCFVCSSGYAIARPVRHRDWGDTEAMRGLQCLGCICSRAHLFGPGGSCHLPPGLVCTGELRLPLTHWGGVNTIKSLTPGYRLFVFFELLPSCDSKLVLGGRDRIKKRTVISVMQVFLQ